MDPSGRRIVLPSLFTFCHSLPGGRFSFQCGGGSGLTGQKRAQVGPIDTDVIMNLAATGLATGSAKLPVLPTVFHMLFPAVARRVFLAIVGGGDLSR